MFIDTLVLLSTRKRVDKRRTKKDIHPSSTTKENLLQRMIHLFFTLSLLYALIRVVSFLFSSTLPDNNDDDGIEQSVVPIELRRACG